MTTQFTAKIHLGNEAMKDKSQIAAALREIAAKLGQGESTGSIYDENGNSVGHFGFFR